jgi:formylglycine-generating enzyme required for sulfatase activity
MSDKVGQEGGGLGGLLAKLLPRRQDKVGSAARKPQPDSGVPVPELVMIPAGEFIMGSDKRRDEMPQHTELLTEYAIGKYPVTNAEFARFVEDSGYETTAEQPNRAGGAPWKPLRNPIEGADWRHAAGPQSAIDKRMSHPVVSVSWRDAVAYCTWLAQKTGQSFRLPTEAEWEKAARGTDGREYPWGNTFESYLCNTVEGKVGTTTPVGRYSPAGDSPYGASDMAGNVWEWCSTIVRENYSTEADESLGGDAGRVLRGGAFCYYASDARCAFRGDWFPDAVFHYVGFRVAVTPTG